MITPNPAGAQTPEELAALTSEELASACLHLAEQAQEAEVALADAQHIAAMAKVKAEEDFTAAQAATSKLTAVAQIDALAPARRQREETLTRAAHQVALTQATHQRLQARLRVFLVLLEGRSDA